MVLAACFSVAACGEPEKPAVSLEEAKKITAQFQPQDFTPPPRTINDITAILEQQKPDPAKAEVYRKAAEAQPPSGLSGADLMQFYFTRALANQEIGRLQQQRTDLREAVRVGQESHVGIYRPMDGLVDVEMQVGTGPDTLNAVRAYQAAIPSNDEGAVMHAHTILARVYAELGDLASAESELRQAQAIYDSAPAWRSWAAFGELFTAILLVDRATVDEARGRFAEAEAELRKAIVNRTKALSKYDEMQQSLRASGLPPFPKEYMLTEAPALRQLARVLRAQGKLLEAEVEARRALLLELERRGHYATDTALAVIELGRILKEQGRYAEAEKLGLAAVDIYENLGGGTASWQLAEARTVVADAQAAQGRWSEAQATFQKLEQVLGDDPAGQDRFVRSSAALAVIHLNSQQPDLAVPILRRVAEARARTLGPDNASTAEAHGLLAAALVRSGKRDPGIAEFNTAIPILLSRSGKTTDEETQTVARDQRRQVILEAYLGVLADAQKAPAASLSLAAEAFQIADAARSRSVQRALAASAARAAVKDPALADLVRREQDAKKQTTALSELLANALSLPSDQQNGKVIDALRVQIDQLRAARAAIRDEIEKRFPDYVNLIDPKPATIDQAQAALQPGEALITTYVAEDRTYMWAVPKQGPVSFAAVALKRSELEAMVAQLRHALDPNATTLGEIPPFDVALAYKLYTLLLKPVEPGWKGAKSLLVVPHGALGQLPLALLVTAPASLEAEREGQALLSSYRKVPWLVRDVAVTDIPSVASLTTLRAVPPGGARKPFVGFGDPWFSPTQAAEAQAGSAPTQVAELPADAASTLVATRSLPLHRRSVPKTETVDSAQLALLPRLPDTAEEVRQVALALHADPQADVLLGARASEQTVRTMKLDDRRVVMFATHGLVPGDLNGLAEPALALSAPQVAGGEGDGLLTTGKILGLKLDADWVVLSACNTAAGNGAGAEAVSGLGLAFFYAGTRAVLVSSWPVETTSARALTTGLFREEAEKPGLSRAEALRQAMLALIDGPGYMDPAQNRAVFSYAHPIFWAPFSLVGDGGGGKPSS